MVMPLATNLNKNTTSLWCEEQVQRAEELNTLTCLNTMYDNSIPEIDIMLFHHDANIVLAIEIIRNH